MFNSGQPYLAFSGENLAWNRMLPNNPLNSFQDSIEMRQNSDAPQFAVPAVNPRRKRLLFGSNSSSGLSLPAKRRATEEEISKQLSNLNLSLSPSNPIATEVETCSEDESSDEGSVGDNKRLLILPEALRRNHAELSTNGTLSDPGIKKLLAPEDCLALVPYVPRPPLPISSTPVHSSSTPSTPEINSLTNKVETSRPVDVVTEEPMEVLASPPTPVSHPVFFNPLQPAGFPVTTPSQSTIFYEGPAG